MANQRISLLFDKFILKTFTDLLFIFKEFCLTVLLMLIVINYHLFKFL